MRSNQLSTSHGGIHRPECGVSSAEGFEKDKTRCLFSVSSGSEAF